MYTVAGSARMFSLVKLDSGTMNLASVNGTRKKVSVSSGLLLMMDPYEVSSRPIQCGKS